MKEHFTGTLNGQTYETAEELLEAFRKLTENKINNYSLTASYSSDYSGEDSKRVKKEGELEQALERYLFPISITKTAEDENASIALRTKLCDLGREVVEGEVVKDLNQDDLNLFVKKVQAEIDHVIELRDNFRAELLPLKRGFHYSERAELEKELKSLFERATKIKDELVTLEEADRVNEEKVDKVEGSINLTDSILTYLENLLDNSITFIL